MQHLSSPSRNLKPTGHVPRELAPKRLRWYLAFVVLTTLTEACFVATTLPVSLG